MDKPADFPVNIIREDEQYVATFDAWYLGDKEVGFRLRFKDCLGRGPTRMQALIALELNAQAVPHV